MSQPISTAPPRQLSDYPEMDLKKGLKTHYFFGYFFLIGLAIILVMPPYALGIMLVKVIAGAIVFGGFGAYALTTANKKYQQRKQAFEQGIFVTGTVQEHRRKFNPFSSKRYYTVVLSFPLPNGKATTTSIQSTDKNIWRKMPEGTTVKGLYNTSNGAFFIPSEIGIAI